MSERQTCTCGHGDHLHTQNMGPCASCDCNSFRPIHGDRDESGDTAEFYFFKPTGKWKYSGEARLPEGYSERRWEWSREKLAEFYGGRLPGVSGTLPDLALVVIPKEGWPQLYPADGTNTILLTALQEADEALEWAEQVAKVQADNAAPDIKHSLDRHARALARLRELANHDM